MHKEIDRVEGHRAESETEVNAAPEQVGKLSADDLCFQLEAIDDTFIAEKMEEVVEHEAVEEAEKIGCQTGQDGEDPKWKGACGRECRLGVH